MGKSEKKNVNAVSSSFVDFVDERFKETDGLPFAFKLILFQVTELGTTGIIL